MRPVGGWFFGRYADRKGRKAAMLLSVLLMFGGSLHEVFPSVNGIGDMNPLYRDLEVGRLTRHGSMLAHPMFPMAFGWVGRTRWGLSGVHGFYAGNDWECFRHIRPGDRITAIERVVGVEVKESKFSGTLVLQYVEASYANQRGELIAYYERRGYRRTGEERPFPYDDARFGLPTRGDLVFEVLAKSLLELSRD